MQTYKGSCHCGAVAFTVTADITQVMSCNCSHCSRKGFLLNFVPAENFTLEKGEENLAEYLFNKNHISHLFCKTCGVQGFARAQNKEGVPTIALNVRCIPDIDLKSLTITEIDGKSF